MLQICHTSHGGEKQNVQKVHGVGPDMLADIIIQVQTFRSTASGKKWLLVPESIRADGTG